jgi:outer membrane lipoprotein-sorting protein
MTVLLGASAAPLLAAEASPLLVSWLASQANVHAWAAEFTQTRTLKALVQPLAADGRVWFEAPNRFRWELGNPPQTVAVRAPTEVLIFYPRLKRVERYSLTEPQKGPWRDALSLLETGFARSLAELEARYTILSEAVESQTCRVSLQPKATAARRMMPRIEIDFDSKNLQLLGTEIQFADGSKMRNDFRKAVLNPPVDSQLFTPTIPPDYEIVEPLKQASPK